MNSRAKGQRTFQKAVRYALSFPGTVVLPLYQVSRWATAQPFDMLVLRPTHPPLFVEVRSNQWGVNKPQTRLLTALPGVGYQKHIWMFKDGAQQPHIRGWNGTAWVPRVQPW